MTPVEMTPAELEITLAGQMSELNSQISAGKREVQNLRAEASKIAGLRSRTASLVHQRLDEFVAERSSNGNGENTMLTTWLRAAVASPLGVNFGAFDVRALVGIFLESSGVVEKLHSLIDESAVALDAAVSMVHQPELIVAASIEEIDERRSKLLSDAHTATAAIEQKASELEELTKVDESFRNGHFQHYKYEGGNWSLRTPAEREARRNDFATAQDAMYAHSVGNFS